MSRADGVLVVSLAYKWFDMIASGDKLEEYRGGNWASRILSDKTLAEVWWQKEGFDDPNDFHGYHTLRAQRAYSGVWLERKIQRIRWGTPRPEWSGETVSGSCFVIELAPELLPPAVNRAEGHGGTAMLGGFEKT